MTRRRGGERGVALMLVLWVVIVLAAIASGVVVAARRQTALAAALRSRAAARYAAESGVAAARAELRALVRAARGPEDQPRAFAGLDEAGRGWGEHPLGFCFQPIHIDAARNSTDDFNPFHDPRKCHRIRGNPYPGAIALGFQLECLIEHQLRLHRERQGANDFIAGNALHFSYYQFTFANVLLPGEPFRVEIKPTLRNDEVPGLSNRVVVRKDDATLMIGHQRESARPLYLGECVPGPFHELRQAADRGLLPGSNWFLKRKFMNTANAKNFVAGSLCDQGYYFDELEDRVNFPHRP